VGHHAGHLAARVEYARDLPREAVEALDDGADFLPYKAPV
jgi:hypothetical protein